LIFALLLNLKLLNKENRDDAKIINQLPLGFHSVGGIDPY
jgi:hypothetical protein